MLEQINNLLGIPNIGIIIVKANAESLKQLSGEIQNQSTLPLELTNVYLDTQKSNGFNFGQKLSIFMQFGTEIWILHDEEFEEPCFKYYLNDYQK